MLATRLLGAACAAVVLLARLASAQTTPYSISPIPLSPDDTFPYFMDMNARGQVVASTFSGPPLLYTPDTGKVSPLQTPNPFGNFATGINDYGQIVGASNNVPLLWQPDAPGAVPGAPVPLPLATGFAHGINEFGQVVGDTINGGLGTGFLFTPFAPNTTKGAVTLLNNGFARDINDRGQVAGAGRALGAYLWQPSAPNSSDGTSQALGVTSLSGADYLEISAGGAVAVTGGVGASDPSGAHLWRPASPNGTAGTLAPIAGFPGAHTSFEILAHGPQGQVLITSYDAGGADPDMHAWLYTPGGGLTDLNALLSPADVAAGWNVYRAGTMNDLGQIVAFATRTERGGPPTQWVVLLDPVPEPALIAPAGLTSLLLLRRRRAG